MLYGVGLLAPCQTSNLEDQGTPFCLGHHLWLVWRWRLYQWQYYCKHSFQDYLTTQTPPLSQSRDTVRVAQWNGNWENPAMYVGCPESIHPFWISREPVAWPWCNLAASQRSPYCASVNSHSPVGLVSWQWDAVDWAYVLRDCCIHSDWASRSDIAPAHSTALVQAFLAKHHIAQVCQPPYIPDLAPCNFWLFPELKSLVKGKRLVNATVTQYTSSINGVSLPTGQPHGIVTVHRCAVMSPLSGCQITSRPPDQFSRYWKWMNTFQTALVYSSKMCRSGVNVWGPYILALFVQMVCNMQKTWLECQGPVNLGHLMDD